MQTREEKDMHARGEGGGGREDKGILFCGGKQVSQVWGTGGGAYGLIFAVGRKSTWGGGNMGTQEIFFAVGKDAGGGGEFFAKGRIQRERGQGLIFRVGRTQRGGWGTRNSSIKLH